MANTPHTSMVNQDLIDKVTVLLDTRADIAAYQIGEESKLGVVLRIDAEDSLKVMGTLRHCVELQLEQLIDVFGADVRELIEVTYRLRSLKHNIDLIIKCELPYGGSYTSIGEIYAAAWMPERELCEMFGLILLRHPNPKRLLTMSNMPPFLRKEVAIRNKEEIWGS